MPGTDPWISCESCRRVKVAKRTFQRLHHLYASLQPKVWGVLSFCLVGCFWDNRKGRGVCVCFSFFCWGFGGVMGFLLACEMQMKFEMVRCVFF